MGYYVKVERNVNIYMEDLNPKGSRTIVFVHGWPLNHRLFEYQLNVLPELGFRCIGIDLRGFGKSDKPWHGYDYNRMADDIWMVIRTLQLQNITLVGHSMAGAISIRYMARYNGFGVFKLVLVDAAAPTGFTEETASQLFTKASNDRPNMLEDVADIFFYKNTTSPFTEWFIDLGLEAASWSTLKTIISLKDENVAPDLAHISVPTLIIHGIHDQVIPFSQSQLLHQSIRNSHVLPFKYSGHGPVWEEKDKFNKALVAFIG
ncbi:alpha/beta fold hydrolase [Niallia endozanthoxylica]|uniref:Alpha/beta hydrolase n=1 Tax=Niallia endozanthoxylica TaxID=2036016 RepID=A0A5J5I4H8_9BACI|nr:alpha/beta hydrolase [Niallia endozanthoxylica]KAA9029963.1 alpha/beta hydrolase [Niallia endozanthoxylica]